MKNIILKIALCISVFALTSWGKTNSKSEPEEWSVVELLAEEHPYIVALLNRTTQFICTGAIIGKQSVLTSGNCLKHAPAYVWAGQAVVSRRNMDRSRLYKVYYTKLHANYDFKLLNASQPYTKIDDIAEIHSNIGLVIVERPIGDFYMDTDLLTTQYYPGLNDRELIVIGYGRSIENGSAMALQRQDYHQSLCKNPRWYYCVCGFEQERTGGSLQEFGEGAPVLIKSQLVGVTGAPYGSMRLRSEDVDMNVFTLIAPYLPWLQDIQRDAKTKLCSQSAESNFSAPVFNQMLYFYVIIFCFYLIVK